ncbi:MAG: hypothetical protein H0T47_10150 [Planctomycetaceae bacterium]|nr:hypothetical protein [Planctomycetaceae bacterium]
MPTVTLTDAAGMRLQSISFFLIGFLLAAWGVQAIWNVLQRDWSALPRLSYRLGLTGLWGLLFVLVLTMISGTRELLTPGAWEKQGLTYELRSHATEAPPVEDALVERRREHLRSLGLKLLAFAASHEGRFPSESETADLERDSLQLPQRSASTYRFVPGAKPGARDQIVAFEPAVYGDDPFVLLASGEVVRLTSDELAKRLPVTKDEP